MANPPSKPDKPDPSGRPSVERAAALRDVMAHAVVVEKETRKSSGPPGTSGARRAVALAFSIPALILSIYSYVARPEAIWGPNPSNVTPVRRDANVRFTLYLLSRNIETFRKKTGSYPSDLSGLGSVTASTVKYARLSDSVFELRAPNGASELVFRSDEPVARFLGTSPTVVAGRGRE